MTDDDLLRIATTLGLPFGMLNHDYCKSMEIEPGTRSHGEVTCDGMVRFARAVIGAALPAPAVPNLVESHLIRTAPAVREPLIDEMDAVASKYAHKMALDLECVLAEYGGSWYNTAMQTLSGYRMAMNAIHERESPTHMGEPVLQRKNCDRPDCPAGGYGPCAPCEREHSGG